MTSDSLLAVSPIDGRYAASSQVLSKFFSEFALIRYRLLVEVEYFIALCRLPLPQIAGFDKGLFPQLRTLYQDFTLEDGLRVKAIERTTNHDVKAVEYFMREKFENLGLAAYQEWIHFGLTSQDINNTALPMSLRDFSHQALSPLFQKLLDELDRRALDWMEVPMLARTHGQPASPTRMGKELLVFSERLKRQWATLGQIPFSAKFGGATGNFNAHRVAYPGIDWPGFADAFVNHTLELSRTAVTTQIEPYDDLAAWCDNLRRINTILIDFSRDMWTYISLDYFRQNVVATEVGSSAMPHKVNPIDFENAEGNLGLGNAILGHLASKLPVSRLQRDLTDSTVSRNLGVPLAHTVIAFNALLKGLGKLTLNPEKISLDLEDNWAVVAEAIQTILRRERFPDPYSQLKNLTRTGEKLNQDVIRTFILGLDASEELKMELLAITPYNYVGFKP